MSKVTLLYQDQQVEVPKPKSIVDLYNFACERFNLTSPCFTYHHQNSSDSLIKSQPDLDILLRFNPEQRIVIEVTDDPTQLRPTLKLLRFRKIDSVSTQKSHADNESSSYDEFDSEDSSDSIVIEPHEITEHGVETSAGCGQKLERETETDEVCHKDVSIEANIDLIPAASATEALHPPDLKLKLPSIMHELLTNTLNFKTEITHPNTFCFACKVAPIKGILYQCPVCTHQNFCSRCEALHPHNLFLCRNLAEAARLRERVSEARQEYDEDTVQNLMEVSLKQRDQVLDALRRTKNNLQEALNLLIGSN
mmetsp:Transcript_23744/g.42039  ORF Transcript_23744/g.42039 Transcript_23744/m.42039 type:complete len:309 (+) Transcript_23744:42-968(+)